MTTPLAYCALYHAKSDATRLYPLTPENTHARWTSVDAAPNLPLVAHHSVSRLEEWEDGADSPAVEVTIHDDRWSITEPVTGRLIGFGDTLAEALEMVDRLLTGQTEANVALRLALFEIPGRPETAEPPRGIAALARARLESLRDQPVQHAKYSVQALDALLAEAKEPEHAPVS